MHEAVANHFSLAVGPEGTRFLLNANQMHFSRIRASDLLELDANGTETLSRPGAADATAWGLHAMATASLSPTTRPFAVLASRAS